MTTPSTNGISVSASMSRSSVSNSPESDLNICAAIGHNVTEIVSDDVTDLETSNIVDHQVYMSLVWQNQKLSVAYYETETMVIYMMPDNQESDEFSITKTVLHQISPSCIIVNAKQDERLTQVIEDTVRVLGGEEAAPTIRILPSIDFAPDLSRNRILQLKLPSIPKHYLETECFLYMSSLIPFDNVCMVRAVGGLIKYLNKMRVGVELENLDCDVPILDLRIFSLADNMTINEETLRALQIFKTDFHPSVYKVGQGKEGLSVFGIMNRCKSGMGSKNLRMWFKCPLRNKAKIEERLDAVAYLVNPRNIEATTTIHQCLKHVRPLSRILNQMIQSQASINDWLTLHKTTYNACCIAEVCRHLPQDIAIFHEMDFEMSKDMNRFVVKQNVDETLDEKKRIYHGLPSFLNKVAEQQLSELSDDITQCSIVYLPQLGYLLAVPIESDNIKSEEQLQLPGLQFVFHSNNMAHYRSPRVDELSTHLGDILCDIIDIETRIMHRLQNTVVGYTHLFQDVMHYTADLDCLQALASCASEYNYTRPQFTAHSTIDITAGRHPLQELCCSPYVANDTHSGGGGGGEHTRIKVLTGPNSSGKSVYLKQIGVIVYLAHVGSYVPADLASLPLCDHIFTRIQSLDSVSTGLSTFMIDLNQMSAAIRGARQNSLVLIDEFGKGTDLTDGMAVLCASIQHWASMGSLSPHVFVCTHLHDISQQHLLPESPLITYQTMEIFVNKEELVFLYQLKSGQAHCSFANHAALKAGLPDHIISRAKQVHKLRKDKMPVRRVESMNLQMYMERSHLTVDKFLTLDTQNDDVQSFLTDFVMVTMNSPPHNEI